MPSISQVKPVTRLVHQLQEPKTLTRMSNIVICQVYTFPYTCCVHVVCNYHGQKKTDNGGKGAKKTGNNKQMPLVSFLCDFNHTLRPPPSFRWLKCTISSLTRYVVLTLLWKS